MSADQHCCDLLRRPLPQADGVAADYSTSAEALLYGGDRDNRKQPDGVAEYLRTFYCDRQPHNKKPASPPAFVTLGDRVG